MRCPLPAAGLALAALVPPAVPSTEVWAEEGVAEARSDDTLPLAAAALGRWFATWKERQAYWSGAEVELERLLTAALAEVRLSRPALAANGALLLDMAGYRGSSFDGSAARLRRRARRALEGTITGGSGAALLDWMADEVIALRSQHPRERRAQALELLDAHRTDGGRLALLTVGRDEDDPLRPAALQVLATWPDEAVDLFLVGLLGKTYDKRTDLHPFNLALARLQVSSVPLGPRAAELLKTRLSAMLLKRDWREASRAIELARGLEPRVGVPLLLDALSAWHRRESQGNGSRRILFEVVRELRRISGKSIGTNPKNWITWWISVRQGRTPLAQDALEPEEPRTEATFFGLRPVTDQVTFVIDISGSMATEWGTTEHNRYVEAVEQMMRFLQAAGSQTRFNVILFSDAPLRSSPNLVLATAQALSSARASLLTREPDGGTYLRPAIELALRLDADGQADAERLEADTIVVLCDGETGEGPRWVRPLIERVNDDARVVFHCVLIGSRGDGTLERLARLTGGDFIRIGG